MLIESFLTIFLAVIVLAIKPGPYMMAFIGLATSGKWKEMIIFWLGSVTAGTILYVFFLKTLSLLPAGFGLAMIFIKAIAAVIFVSMGLNGLKDSLSDYKSASKKTQERIGKASILANLGAGFFLTISNPYDIVFVVTVIPALLNQTSFSILDILYIRGAVVAADVLVLMAYCLPLLFIRNFLNDDILRKIKAVSSAALIGVGIYIFATIIMRWDLLQASLISS
ncbi:MAG: hypothetical protein CMH32_05110 [Micavibrio sp.]|nr:hypothetical protein [Micavibrio sp.]HCK32583.1 hypothetical protein [Rhodospirillaceae bacterium]|tara:strand:+ start:667 stop:1338 length:672 start_codon:yes stop_codon:yes gene_type:complete